MASLSFTGLQNRENKPGTVTAPTDSVAGAHRPFVTAGWQIEGGRIRAGARAAGGCERTRG
ncbi:MAG: hypothetical protein WCI88_04995 [Chloroflexota bacterium]